MNTRLFLSTITLAFAGVGFGAAHAGTTAGNPPIAKAEATTGHATPSKHASAHRKHHAAHAAHTTAMDRVHQRVVMARSAEQRRWIHAELRQHRIGSPDAASLRQSVASIARQQVALARRGHETVDQALAVSHEQDILDWAIKTDSAAMEPQNLFALG